MASTTLDFIAAGGNRHPAAADWQPGLVAFGSGNNIALWNPEDLSSRGIFALLAGHKDAVNAVKIFDGPSRRVIISGSADKTIRLWTADINDGVFKETQCLMEHQGSVNVIAALEQRGIFVSGSADGTVKVWEMESDTAKLLQSIELKPKYLPLTCALHHLASGDVVLAVSGTCNFIQLYVRSKNSKQFVLQATLPGHEGWIRSLDFTQEKQGDDSDMLLASASQDKYIRLWRLQRSTANSEPLTNGSTGDLVGPAKKSLSSKSHQVGSDRSRYNVTFEALLIGHEDWIYTAKWAPPTRDQSPPTLLSASADNSLAIWRADDTSGVWICQTRLGDISSQKGSTTATGSTGGFWIGLWQPEGQGLVSLGRTGSWRRWAYDSDKDLWVQQVGVTGHTQEVRSTAWAKDGSYLLSTGADQTTRLFAEWKRDGKRSWHAFARPQIHGYDLNCIDSLSADQFISGADEKLLRVFNKPGAIDQLLAKLSGTARSHVNGVLPDSANIPVLGLSNKAVESTTEDDTSSAALLNGVDEQSVHEQPPVPTRSILDLDHPPLEDHLARHTLWPEHEKLYGHGYEISAVAASHNGSLIATACKASSIDHAVIRLYECKEWREVKPPLTAHNLTVTSLEFSPDDKYLLSVSRDRSLAVFKKGENGYDRVSFKEKAHSRMILDCSWASSETGHIFATAGRDKAVKIWKMTEGDGTCMLSVSATAAVTAVACASLSRPDAMRLAYGTDDGSIHIVDVERNSWKVVSDYGLDKSLIPSAGVNALRWRPSTETTADGDGEAVQLSQLAVASDDSSVRILNIGG